MIIFPVNAVRGCISRAKASSPALEMEDYTKYHVNFRALGLYSYFCTSCTDNFLLPGLTPLQHGSQQKPHEAPPSRFVNSNQVFKI